MVVLVCSYTCICFRPSRVHVCGHHTQSFCMTAVQAIAVSPVALIIFVPTDALPGFIRSFGPSRDPRELDRELRQQREWKRYDARCSLFLSLSHSAPPALSCDFVRALSMATDTHSHVCAFTLCASVHLCKCAGTRRSCYTLPPTACPLGYKRSSAHAATKRPCRRTTLTAPRPRPRRTRVWVCRA